ncbi:hypothetical protein GA0070616_4345 [Micromonospora nigra]|uniref:Uncharacterized protein n=1 Tax=Micromonospora nigra TaxID=145857 RepID=A0A1C6SRC4_9ACTN|nr:hypothetical protein [Micromonospora nigra]SCL31859.1 hypothetical protein GA0070616_4345 [Micromonospora nigra]
MMTHDPASPTGPRRYWLRIYDGRYEVLHHRQHLVTLDLDAPGIDGILDQHLQQLTRAALADNEPMDAPRLEVCDVATGAVVIDRAGM